MATKSSSRDPVSSGPDVLARQVFRLIKNRRTVRRFQSRPLPASALKRILEAGNWAPFSAYAPQGRRLIALKAESRQAAAEIVRQCPAIVKYLRIRYEASAYGHEQEWSDKAREFGKTLGGAPVMIVTAVQVVRERYPMMHNMAAAWVAGENMMIQAAAEGLATGVVTFTTPRVQTGLLRLLGLTPGEWVVANVLNVGYPAEKPSPPPRSEDLIAIRA